MLCNMECIVSFILVAHSEQQSSNAAEGLPPFNLLARILNLNSYEQVLEINVYKLRQYELKIFLVLTIELYV